MNSSTPVELDCRLLSCLPHLLSMPVPRPARLLFVRIVTAIARDTTDLISVRLRPMRPIDHARGQRLVVRLTAEDGYTATRTYPIVSAPNDRGDLSIAVALRPGEEVSAFLGDELRVGDKLEVRGPIGAGSPVSGRSG